MYKKHWMKHTAMVPKGFIRYQVLESLGEKAMSGSEIMDEIEKRTDGHWKPSPGSIYPLLGWLQDNKNIKELPTDLSGLKRYELTESGKALLEEQKKIMNNHLKTFKEYKKGVKAGRFFVTPLMWKLWTQLSPEKTSELHETTQRLRKAFFEFRRNLEGKTSNLAIEEAIKLLNETTSKLENINQKLLKATQGNPERNRESK